MPTWTQRCNRWLLRHVPVAWRDRALVSVDRLHREELDDAWGGPFNGQSVRRATVEWLIDTFAVTTALETGTYRGTTTAWLARDRGLTIHTVEVSPRYYRYARARFRRDARVECHLGDSRAFLCALAPRVPGDTRLLVYLDAHWEDDLPLAEEVAVTTAVWPRSLVVIDDFRVPWDAGYGYDDYGPERVIEMALLPPIPGFDVYLPSGPASSETGKRRGWAVLVPAADRATMAGAPGLRRWTGDESSGSR